MEITYLLFDSAGNQHLQLIDTLVHSLSSLFLHHRLPDLKQKPEVSIIFSRNIFVKHTVADRVILGWEGVSHDQNQMQKATKLNNSGQR